MKIVSREGLQEFKKKIDEKCSSFSSEDKVIDTWIDGSPIYRKSFDTILSKDNTDSNASIQMHLMSSSDIGLLVGCNLYIKSKYHQWWPVPSYHRESGYITSIYLDDNYLTLEVGSFFSVGSSRVVGYIDYIKPQN